MNTSTTAQCGSEIVGETPERQFCEWLSGYLMVGPPGLDEFDTNVVRQTLNSVLAGNYISPPAALSSKEPEGK